MDQQQFRQWDSRDCHISDKVISYLNLFQAPVELLILHQCDGSLWTKICNSPSVCTNSFFFFFSENEFAPTSNPQFGVLTISFGQFRCSQGWLYTLHCSNPATLVWAEHYSFRTSQYSLHLWHWLKPTSYPSYKTFKAVKTILRVGSNQISWIC